MITAQSIADRYADMLSVHRSAVFGILQDQHPQVASDQHKSDLWALLVDQDEHAVLRFYKAMRSHVARDEALTALAASIEQLRLDCPLRFVNAPSSGVLLAMRIAEDKGLPDDAQHRDDRLRYLRRDIRDGHDSDGRRRDFWRLTEVLSAADLRVAIRAGASYEEFMSR